MVDVDRNDDPSLIHIVGNSGGRYFGVESYDDAGNRIELLVNTTEPYDGVRPLDFLDGEHTTRFQITAIGAWTIEIWPLSQVSRVEVPGTLSGVGDYVFALSGDEPDLAIINANAASRYFGVITWGESGRRLLVNTTDPVVDGRYIVPAGTLLFEVLANGSWTIEITD